MVRRRSPHPEMRADPRIIYLSRFLEKWRCEDDHEVLRDNWFYIWDDPVKRQQVMKFVNPPHCLNKSDLAAETAIIIFDDLDD